MRTAGAREAIVAQGDTSREFYVVLDGELEVLVDGERVRALGPGDFFGELAAMDWGAGFGYPRLATVVAVTPARLRVVPREQMIELASQRAEVGAAILAAVRERLPRH